MSSERSNYWLRRHDRRRFLVGGATMSLGAAAILAGCGDDDDDDGDGNGTPAPGGTGTAAVQGKRGGTFRVSTLDPHRGSDPMINTLEPVFHSPRVYSWTHRYVVSENKIVNDMATSIETPDSTTIIVKIRPDIKFHNVAPMNGRVVKAQDLVYTYNRFPSMAAKGSPINALAYNWMDLPNVKAVDDTTISIKMKKPFAEALQMMAQHFYGVVAQEVDQANGGDLSKVNTAGCGPYILTQADPSVKMVWTRNPEYFSHDHTDANWFPAGGGYPDAYEQRVIPDPATTQAQLISGDLDQLYFNILNVDRVLANELKGRGLQVQEGQANTNCTLVMNMDNFGDKRLRQAIQKAIDYNGFTQTVYLGDGELGAPVGNGYPDSVRLPRDQVAGYLKHDPAEAKKLWDAAGGGNRKLTMLSIANFPFMEQATGFVKQSLEKALGVSVQLDAIDIPSWIARARQTPTKDWDFLVQFSQSTPDVPTFNILGTFDPNGTASNGSLYKVDSSNSAIAELAKQAVTLSDAHYAELNPQARTAKLHAFQKFALENVAPGIPLPVRKIDWLVTNKRVKNVPVKNPSFFRLNLVDSMWLDPTSP